MGNKFLETTKGSWKEHGIAIVSTVMWSVFLLAGAFAALSLRGNIHFTETANAVLGDTIATFVLIALFSIVYRANFESKAKKK